MPQDPKLMLVILNEVEGFPADGSFVSLQGSRALVRRVTRRQFDRWKNAQVELPIQRVDERLALPQKSSAVDEGVNYYLVYRAVIGWRQAMDCLREYDRLKVAHTDGQSTLMMVQADRLIVAYCWSSEKVEFAEGQRAEVESAMISLVGTYGKATNNMASMARYLARGRFQTLTTGEISLEEFTRRFGWDGVTPQERRAQAE